MCVFQGVRTEGCRVVSDECVPADGRWCGGGGFMRGYGTRCGCDDDDDDDVGWGYSVRRRITVRVEMTGMGAVP